MIRLPGILGGGTQSRAFFLRRNGPIIMVYAFILLLFVIGATQSERFLTERNLANVARQSAFLPTNTHSPRWGRCWSS